MRRFKLNRSVTFALALLVSCAVVASSPARLRADTGDPSSGDGGDGYRQPGTPPDPTGTGDPDFPSSPGRQSLKPGATRLGSPGEYKSSAPIVDGASVSPRVWMMRFRVGLRVLRAYYWR